MESKFKGTCEFCGKSWLPGTSIDKTGKQKATGKDAWCPDGRNCQGLMETSGTQQFTNTAIFTDPGELSDDEQILVDGEKRLESIAYKIAKDSHPDMDENSNTFGQIVNAKTSHLEMLMLIKALKEKSS